MSFLGIGGDHNEDTKADVARYGKDIGAEGLAEAGRYSGQADAARGREANRLDRGDINSAQGLMRDQYNQANKMATGPSEAANAQIRASGDQMAQAMAGAAASGGSPGAQLAAMRNAQGAVSAARTQGANEAVASQERMNQFGAQLASSQANQLGNLGLQASQADLASANMNRQLNDQTSLQYEQMRQGIYSQSMAENVARNQMNAQIASGQDSNRDAGNRGIAGAAAEGGGKIIGGAMSDIRAKTGVVGGRASGGPVAAGTPYIVGERGPELIVPRGNGYVIPAGETHALLRSDERAKVSVSPGSGAYGGLLNDDPMADAPSLSPVRGNNMKVGDEEWLAQHGSMKTPQSGSEVAVHFGPDGTPKLVPMNSAEGGSTQLVETPMPPREQRLAEDAANTKSRFNVYTDKKTGKIVGSDLDGPEQDKVTFANVEKPSLWQLLGDGLSTTLTAGGRNLAGKPSSGTPSGYEENMKELEKLRKQNALNYSAQTKPAYRGQ